MSHMTARSNPTKLFSARISLCNRAPDHRGLLPITSAEWELTPKRQKSMIDGVRQIEITGEVYKAVYITGGAR